ncbi:MAG: hypothetical protein ABMA25_11675 [Ilumatobacteraceae bacterium]
MGLFSRDGGGAAGTATAAATATTPLPRRPSFNHAALDRADIEDAKRGYPAVSLQPFAAAAGLGYTNNELHGGFLSNLPKFPGYVFNVCHGTFPGGRLGLLQHELLELETDQDGIRGGGTFYSVRVVTRYSTKELLGVTGDPIEAPFLGNAAWLPITSVHLRTPELNQLPVFTVREVGFTVLARGKLDQYGLPGFRVDRGPKDPTMLSAIATACAGALPTRRDSYVRLQVRYGVLSLTVNGYRADEQDLHHLTAVATHIADSLTALTRNLPGAAFTTAGPSADTSAPPEGVPKPHPSYRPAYAKAGPELTMLHEDPYYLSHLLPKCPIPGVPSGVLFGNLPGTSTVGRLAWFELGNRFSGSVRGGAIAPAADGATTPLGGTYHAPTGMHVEVVDGIAYCWLHPLLSGRLGARELVTAAQAAFTATGTATI